MTTDHGPQDDIRPLTPAEADEALKNAKNRNASEEEIDRIVEAVTRGELPKVNDHGPQRQPEREMSRSEISGELVEMWWLRDELARLRAENERYRGALMSVIDWYYRDGSVGGCDVMIEEVLRPLIERKDWRRNPPDVEYG